MSIRLLAEKPVWEQHVSTIMINRGAIVRIAGRRGWLRLGGSEREIGFVFSRAEDFGFVLEHSDPHAGLAFRCLKSIGFVSENSESEIGFVFLASG